LPIAKKLPWKPIPQKNANIVDTEYNIAITKQMLSSIDFENAFISIPLNISDIEPKEDSNANESKEFNTDT